MASSEEDDYLTMAIPDPSATKSQKHETLTEKKKRLAREAEVRANPKSKAELAAEAKRKREEGLQKNLLGDGVTKSKGAAMMAKLGYKPGTALGKAGDAKDERLLEPLGISEREGRGGIGADAEKKRKIREEFAEREEEEKRQRVDAEEYRERVAKEREEARREGQVWGAMKVAEKLDEEDEAGEVSRDVIGEAVRKTAKKKRLSEVNVLWRGLVKQREVSERDRRMRYDLHQSLSSRVDYNDPEEDREDKMALGRKDAEEVDVELDQEDEDLNEFEQLEASEKLDKLVKYLRERWRYCFWCKYRYPDEEMGGCPGTSEEDHD